MTTTVTFKASAVVRARIEELADAYRHTTATEMRAAGLDFKMIQSIIGHSSVTTTFDRYTHVSRQHLQAAADQFEAHVTASE
jgi:site-specific recombinase XerD